MQISDCRVWTENGKDEEQICKERSVNELSEFEQYCSWHSQISFYFCMKDKIVAVHPTRGHVEGMEVQLHSFLNLGARQSYVPNITPRPLHAEEIIPVPIEFEGFCVCIS